MMDFGGLMAYGSSSHYAIGSIPDLTSVFEIASQCLGHLVAGGGFAGG